MSITPKRAIFSGTVQVLREEIQAMGAKDKSSSSSPKPLSLPVPAFSGTVGALKTRIYEGRTVANFYSNAHRYFFMTALGPMINYQGVRECALLSTKYGTIANQKGRALAHQAVNSAKQSAKQISMDCREGMKLGEAQAAREKPSVANFCRNTGRYVYIMARGGIFEFREWSKYTTLVGMQGGALVKKAAGQAKAGCLEVCDAGVTYLKTQAVSDVKACVFQSIKEGPRPSILGVAWNVYQGAPPLQQNPVTLLIHGSVSILYNMWDLFMKTW